MSKRIGVFCLSLLLLLLLVRGCTPVQAQTQIGSRLSNLEVNVSSLRSQINRLEAQLQQGRGKSGTRPAPPATSSKVQVYPTEAMFDRLATLVIELKERLNEVEARLSKLESQSSPKPNS